MHILERYEVDPHAYGYCSTCATYFDYWKYGDEDFMCPYDCGTRLRELNPIELAEALVNCEGDKCFEEEFLYSTPLMPKLKPVDRKTG
jgi:hypothetical protein